MAFELGVSPGSSMPLSRRIAWLIGIRLLFLAALLGLIGLSPGDQLFAVDSFTTQVAAATLAVAFALAGAYAVVLRSGRYLGQLSDFQVVCDQATWTVVVYLSGGASSGATSLYGLSCVAGAALAGMRGAGIAAAAGGVCYGGLVLALAQGWIAPPPDQPPGLYALASAELAYNVLITYAALAVVAAMAGYLAERLRMTGGQLAAAEERAEQAERLAVLGRIAAGLAHEIRNPLGSIAGSVQLLKTSSGLTDEDRQLCEIVEREAARLEDLVTDMMDLTRRREPEMVRVDAARVAQDVVILARQSGRGTSDVLVRYQGAEHAEVHADAAQLRQLIWNLVRNAVQASSAEDVVRVAVDVQDGHVELRVEDDGVGIDEQARRRLFDALYTGRTHGTGLGLAVVKRIADEHGFPIGVESEQGRGATFRVALGAAVAVRSPADDSPARR